MRLTPLLLALTACTPGLSVIIEQPEPRAAVELIDVSVVHRDIKPEKPAPTRPEIAQAASESDSPPPPGFPANDEFSSLEQACDALVPRLVGSEDLRAPILDWCHRRAWASSRNGVVRSRMDGSQIHDRDRPAALGFYREGIRSGSIDPITCSHHVVDTSIKRTRADASFPRRWPYGTFCDRREGDCSPRSPGKMLDRTADKWMSHAPDYERYGTRGPMDNHYSTAVRYLGGCFAPESLDRFDVAAAVVIERAEDLCAKLEDRLDTRREREAAKEWGMPTTCRKSSDIREIWHPRFWRALRGIT